MRRIRFWNRKRSSLSTLTWMWRAGKSTETVPTVLYSTVGLHGEFANSINLWAPRRRNRHPIIRCASLNATIPAFGATDHQSYGSPCLFDFAELLEPSCRLHHLLRSTAANQQQTLSHFHNGKKNYLQTYLIQIKKNSDQNNNTGENIDWTIWISWSGRTLVTALSVSSCSLSLRFSWLPVLLILYWRCRMPTLSESISRNSS